MIYTPTKNKYCQYFAIFSVLFLFSGNALADCNKVYHDMKKMSYPLVIVVPSNGKYSIPVFSGTRNNKVYARTMCDPIDYVYTNQRVVVYERSYDGTLTDYYKITYLDKKTGKVKHGYLNENDSRGRESMFDWNGYLITDDPDSIVNALTNDPVKFHEYVFTRNTKVSAEGFSLAQKNRGGSHKFHKGDIISSISTSKRQYVYEHEGRTYYLPNPGNIIIKKDIWNKSIVDKNENRKNTHENLLKIMAAWCLLLIGFKKGRFYLDKYGNSLFGNNLPFGLIVTAVTVIPFYISNKIFNNQYDWLDGADAVSGNSFATILFLPFAVLLPFVLYFLYLAMKSSNVGYDAAVAAGRDPRDVAKKIGKEDELRGLGKNALKFKAEEARVLTETLRAKEAAHKANIDAAKKKVEEEMLKRYTDDKG